MGVRSPGKKLEIALRVGDMGGKNFNSWPPSDPVGTLGLPLEKF